MLQDHPVLIVEAGVQYRNDVIMIMMTNQDIFLLKTATTVIKQAKLFKQHVQHAMGKN
jgi:hypothetical protein